MIDAMLNIFLGVFSGIASSILIWISIRIFKQIIIPWYQKSIYRGIDISGEWTSKSEFSGAVIVEQLIQVIQSGHKISGSLISRNRIPNKPENTTYYNIEGEIFDNYVDIEYRIVDRKSVGRGSFLLKVREGGMLLSGGLIAIDRYSTNVMVSDKIIWERSK